MPDSNTNDLANGYFIEDWNPIIRWVLFLPAAFLGSFVVSVLYSLSSSFFYQPGFLIGLIGSGLLGYTFVFFGAFVAPKKQFEVSIFLLMLISAIATIASIGTFISTNGFLWKGESLLGVIIMLAAAGGAVVQIKKEI